MQRFACTNFMSASLWQVRAYVIWGGSITQMTNLQSYRLTGILCVNSCKLLSAEHNFHLHQKVLSIRPEAPEQNHVSNNSPLIHFFKMIFHQSVTESLKLLLVQSVLSEKRICAERKIKTWEVVNQKIRHKAVSYDLTNFCLY